MISSIVAAIAESIGRRTQPPLGLQDAQAACGYVCISGVFSLFSVYLPHHAVRSLAGSTTRGLRISQIRDILRQLGASVEVIGFEVDRWDSMPEKSIVLLTSGHYVVVDRISGSRARVFFPEKGWSRVSFDRLRRQMVGIAVAVKSVDLETVPQYRRPSNLIFREVIAGFRSTLGKKLLLFAIAAEAAQLLYPLVSKYAVDLSIGAPQASTVSYIGLGYFFLAALGLFGSTANAVYFSVMQGRISGAVTRRLFFRLFRQTDDWFSRHAPSHYYNQMALASVTQSFFQELPFRIVSILIQAAAGIAILFCISPALVLPGLIATALAALVELGLNSRIRAVKTESIRLQAAQRGLAFDLLPIVPSFRRAGSIAGVWRRFRLATFRALTAVNTSARLHAVRSALLSGARGGEQILFACLAGVYLQASGQTLGAFVALGLYKDQLARAIGGALQLWQQYDQQRPQLEELGELLGDHEGGPLPSQSKSTVSAGQVRLTGVILRYGELDRPVLTDVSLQVRPGEMVAIRGESGHGKTTLLKAICGELPAMAGRITIDGLPPVPGMVGVGIVLQTDRLVAGTLRENVVFYRRNVSDAEVFQVLDAVELGEFVRGLPMGLNTEVGEGLSGLSGGQRQRLLLARALIGQPRLLILDEATSSLDVATESRILAALRRSGATTLLCAHRPEVWQQVDRLYEVVAGTVRAVEWRRAAYGEAVPSA